MPRVRFDPTVNWGHIATILAFIGSTMIAYSAVARAIDNHELRLKTIEVDRLQVPRFREIVLSSQARLEALERMQAQSLQVNQRLLDQIGGLREDIAALKAKN